MSEQLQPPLSNLDKMLLYLRQRPHRLLTLQLVMDAQGELVFFTASEDGKTMLLSEYLQRQGELESPEPA